MNISQRGRWLTINNVTFNLDRITRMEVCEREEIKLFKITLFFEITNPYTFYKENSGLFGKTISKSEGLKDIIFSAGEFAEVKDFLLNKLEA